MADQHPDIVRDLEARLLDYARQQKPSLWIKAQPGFVGAQGKAVFDPDFDIDGRAAAFFPCTYMPKEITQTPANWYVVAQGDKNREPFVAGKTYRVKVPKDVPVWKAMPFNSCEAFANRRGAKRVRTREH